MFREESVDVIEVKVIVYLSEFSSIAVIEVAEREKRRTSGWKDI